MADVSGQPASLRPLKALLALAVLTPVLLFGAAAWQSYGAAFREAGHQVDGKTALLREYAIKAFQHFDLILNQVESSVASMDWEAIGRSQSLHHDLRRLSEGAPQVNSLWLIGPDGWARASSTTYPTPAIDLSDRSYFQAVAQGQPHFISEAFVGRQSNVPVFAMVRRRPAADGRFDGLILAAIHSRSFQDFFAGVRSDPKGVVSLTREDGEFLMRHPAVDRLLPRLGPGTGLRTAITQAPEGGVFRTRSALDGIERIYGYRRLGNLPIYVTLGISLDRVWEQWRHEVAFHALFAGPSALLLLLFALLVLRRAQAEQAASARLREEMARREAAEATVRHAQRLEMLGQIAGGIAHDFNNLLMVITSNLYLAQSRCGPAASGLPFIEAAAQAAYRGGELTRQLLTFARRQALDTEAFDLNACLRDLAEGMLKQSLRGDITIQLDLAADLGPVAADRGQFELAVLNLAVNARDAMPLGGTLALRTRAVVFTAPDLSPNLIGDFGVLTVADTGDGIPLEVQERVFEPFFTTKAVGKGTGLGLSMVYGFAHQSGGAVRLDSLPGAGTAIHLYLPRATAPTAPTDGGEAMAAVAGARSGTILLVEDSAEIRATVSALLASFGYDVIEAGDAPEALERLKAGPMVDLVLSDIVMPGGLDGVDLARRLRNDYPELPVLLTTGYSDAAGAIADEGFPVLRKPYTPDALARALREALSSRTPVPA